MIWEVGINGGLCRDNVKSSSVEKDSFIMHIREVGDLSRGSSQSRCVVECFAALHRVRVHKTGSGVLLAGSKRTQRPRSHAQCEPAPPPCVNRIVFVHVFVLFLKIYGVAAYPKKAENSTSLQPHQKNPDAQNS